MKRMRDVVDKYFLEQHSPFSSKKTIRMKSVKIAAGVVTLGMILVVLFSDDKQTPEIARSKDRAAPALDAVPATSSTPLQAGLLAGDLYVPSGYRASASAGTMDGPPAPRQYAASQLVAPNDGVGVGGGSLPLGSRIAARLVDQLVSTDSMSPAIAVFTEDGIGPDGTLMIPSGTKVFGQANFDSGTRRMQIRFHTLVFDDGQQRSISAIALHRDGSSGLTGDYHSGSAVQQAGRFLSHFVSGLAGGMREKQITPAGQAYDQGSVKNGLLTGTADAAADQSRRIGQEMEGTRPFLEVAGGTEFLVFLDKEFAL